MKNTLWKNTLRTSFITLLLISLLCFGLLSLPGTARADDNIFPPAPAAASAINFDGRGFLVHGKRTFIASGGMEYARIPHELWRDRLLRLKRAGFNCVEIYTFWNAHEPRPNEFNFSGDYDLGAFLKTVQSLGLYAIVRVGPYVCAEWDSGGYPVWLRFVPGLRVREDNPQFLAAVDRYWDKLMPIVVTNQINRGGPVILVQLENEHPQGWGKVLPNAYFVHLRDKAVALGLQVPYFFSGLHHASDPAGDSPWSSQGRTSPWMSTEFWSVWYDRYGQTEADANAYDRRMWKVLAYGGNGLNFYMFHGGSNFGTTNDDEDTASYDYGAAIGQAGDLRPTYYRFKRAALFARSFEDILENSDNATDTYKAAATSPAVRVTARKSPSGTILFLDNPGKDALKTQVNEADGTLFPASGSLTLAPGQIAPIVRDFPLVPGVLLERATPLLGILKQGKTTTLVAYGPVGDTAELRFKLTGPVTNLHTGGVKPVNGRLTVQNTIKNIANIVESKFEVGGQTIRVLTTSTQYSDHVWFVDSNVIVGPEYVGDVAQDSSNFETESLSGLAYITATFVYNDKLTAFADAGNQGRNYSFGPRSQSGSAPVLSAWQTLTANTEAAPSYADAKWRTSTNPLPMGADGDTGAYAWYRSALTVPKTGTYTLRFADGGDWASVFVGGRHAASGTVKAGVPLTLPAGTYPVAVLTAHYGRPKLFSYLGPIDTIDAKGLRGPVILDAGGVTGTALTAWRVLADADASIDAPPTDTTGAGWADGTTGPDIFNGRRGYAWYVTTLPATAGPQNRLRFENVDDNATVFLNGKQIAAHEGWGQPFAVPLAAAAWQANGPNVLAVRVQNTDGGGGIQGAVTLQTVRPGEETPVTGWKMRGGIEEPGALSGWQTGATPPADGAPAYYRATFKSAPPAATGPHPILRVTTAGLSAGFIWLNGHNLGRYPEKIAVNGLYLPEPWLKAGQNALVIFDEQGKAPTGVTLTVEQAASRFVVPMAQQK